MSSPAAKPAVQSTSAQSTSAQSTSDTHTGRCECGGVSYRTSAPLRDVINCHCPRCRRFSGHHLAGTAVDAVALHLLSSESLRWYEAAAGVEYGFCGICGSSLFWRTAATAERITICAGTLEQPTGLRTTQAWWVSTAADYHDRPDLPEFERDG